MTQAQKDRLKKLPVWTAGYPYEPDMFDSVPVMYIPDQTKWGQVWLWQYSDRGIVIGVHGEVDLNWSAPALIERLDVFTPSHDVPLPPTGETKMYSMTTISNGTRIRADHNVYTNVISSVAANIKVTGDAIWTAPADGANVKAGDIWMHITHGGFTGWTAFRHMGLPICKDLVYPTDPPPVVPAEKVKIVSLTVIAKYADGTTETSDFDPVA